MIAALFRGAGLPILDATTAADDAEVREVAVEASVGNRGDPDDSRGRKIREGIAQKKIEKMQAGIDKLLNMTNRPLRRVVSSIFGFVAHRKHGKAEESVVLASPGDMEILVNTTRAKAGHVARALYSHTQAVSKNLVGLINGSQYMVISECSDDASMWVRRDVDSRDLRVVAKRLSAKAKAKGKSPKAPPSRIPTRRQHVPCLNLNQHVVLGKRRAECIEAFELHSPTQAMPKANWATVLDRKRNWSLYSCGQPPRKLQRVDAPGELERAIEEVPVIMKHETQDDASINRCMTAREQLSLDARRRDGKVRTFASLKCLSHQDVLLTKPMYEEQPDYITTLTRASNLLRVGKNLNHVLENVDKYLEVIHEWCVVDRLPEECVEWGARTRWVLNASKATMDLTDDEIETIVSHANSDTRGTKYRHLCIVGSCPCGCVDAASSLKTAKVNFRLMLGKGMDEVLMYRFKNVERANAYNLRGGLYGVLLGALRMTWSHREIDDALTALAAAENPDEVHMAVRNTARAGMVIRALESDPHHLHPIRAHLTTAPAQRYLNATFKADHISCELDRAEALDPQGESAVRARASAFKMNMSFFRGDRGRTVLRSYFAMVCNLDGEDWAMWDGPKDSKITHARRMTQSLVAAWRRLVFPVQQDDLYYTFEACDSNGTAVYDPAKIARHVTVLESKAHRCRHCLNHDHTAQVLPLMKTSPKEFFDPTVSLITHARVNSSSSERKHILGQELKPPRSRGVAADAHALAEFTYRRAASTEGANVYKAVKSCVLQNRGISGVEFAQLSRGDRFSVGRKTRTTENKIWNGKAKRLTNTSSAVSRRRSDGHKVFRRSNWSVRARVGSDAFTREERRISTLWEALGPAERAIYEARAATDHQALTHCLADVNANRAVNTSALPSGTALNVKRAAVQSAHLEINNHPAWARGLQVCSATSALNPSSVDLGPTVSECQLAVRETFAYNPNVTPNPDVCTAPRLPCPVLAWGVCSKTAIAEACKYGTENLYRAMQTLKIKRRSLPLPAIFQVGTHVERHLLVDFVGKGATVFLLALESRPDCWVLSGFDDDKLPVDFDGPRQLPFCFTSQQLIQRMIERATVGAGASLATFTYLKLHIHQTKAKEADGGSLGFTFDPERAHAEKTISFKKQVKPTVETSSGGLLPFGLSRVVGPLEPCVEDPSRDGNEHHECSDDDDDDDAVAVEKVSEMKGHQLGIVGGDVAPTEAAKCLICGSTIGKGNFRFWFRVTKTRAEKSLHPACFSKPRLLAEKGVKEIHFQSTLDFCIGSLQGAPSDVSKPHLEAVMHHLSGTEGIGMASGSAC